MDIPPIPAAPRQIQDKALKAAAQGLEASFLAEMLEAAGVGKTPESFGGGAGEDQFSSFLVQEQARAMAAKGGIGLADTLYRSMKEKFDDQ
ncbi:rod-binding protein [Tropicibacter oceani]|uniref:Rod-binding protein n=1 Tax=Tropicibacter oceani TaxID=3058420 RepID=A0ABY8QKY8_9RHOB|nr:rod-binding protein [Tropicibacter oceani]WGW04673.1 rod-binding protein [Tropicibacter oceani]